jgi:hypothetical protein
MSASLNEFSPKDTPKFYNASVMNSGGLIASLIWGSIGTGVAIYGWRQKAMIPLISGLALIAISYFLLDSALWMSVAAVCIIVCAWRPGKR